MKDGTAHRHPVHPAPAGGVTTRSWPEQFEVSCRTIQRDIESLCRAGIPISTAQGAGGGISIMEGYRVDRTVLTAPEMQAIWRGFGSLDSVSGTRRYAQLMEKLSAGTGAFGTRRAPTCSSTSPPGTRPACRPRSSSFREPSSSTVPSALPTSP